MQVDILHGAAVRGALRLRDGVKDCAHVRFHRVGHGERMDPCADLRKVGMAVKTPLLPALLVAFDEDRDVRAAKAAFLVLRGGDRDLPGQQRVQTPQEIRTVRVQLQQRRRQHIARGAHAAVQVKGLHKAVFLPFGSRIMSEKSADSRSRIAGSSSLARASCASGNWSRALPPAVRTRKSV